MLVIIYLRVRAMCSLGTKQKYSVFQFRACCLPKTSMPAALAEKAIGFWQQSLKPPCSPAFLPLRDTTYKMSKVCGVGFPTVGYKRWVPCFSDHHQHSLCCPLCYMLYPLLLRIWSAFGHPCCVFLENATKSKILSSIKTNASLCLLTVVNIQDASSYWM